MNYQRMAEELARESIDAVRVLNSGSVSGMIALSTKIAAALQAAADTAREWQPIETAPCDMRQILVYDPRIVEGHKVKIVQADRSFWDWMRSDGAHTYSHWMPQPAAPTSTHTPRTAQQSEAVIAKALGKNLKLVEDVK